MHKKVDLRGLTPPEAVVRTKRLLAEAEDLAMDVLVDVGPSKEDILHFATFKKYRATVVAETASAVRLRIIKGNPPPIEEAPPKPDPKAAPAEEKPPQPERPREEVRAERGAPPAAPLLLITSDGIGEDNRRLATSLMANVLQAMAAGRQRPAKIVLMNNGVTLACEGSPALGPLRQLADQGAPILVSSESLDFLGLRARLAAGTAADASQVAEAVLSAAQVLRL